MRLRSDMGDLPRIKMTFQQFMAYRQELEARRGVLHIRIREETGQEPPTDTAVSKPDDD
jgi:hypothetical protein